MAFRKSQQDPVPTFCLIASSTGVCDAMVENGLAALARPEAARRNMERSVRTDGGVKVAANGRSQVRGLVVCRQSATADANQSPAAATVTLNVSAGRLPVEWPMRQNPNAPIPVKPAARKVGRKGTTRATFSEGFPHARHRNFNLKSLPRLPRSACPTRPSQARNDRGPLRGAIPFPPDPQIEHGKPDLLTGRFRTKK